MMPAVQIRTPVFQRRGLEMTPYFLMLALAVVISFSFMTAAAMYYGLSMFWILAELAVAFLAAKAARFLNAFLFRKRTHVLYHFLLPCWAFQYALILTGMPEAFAQIAVLASGMAIATGRMGCLLQGCCHGIRAGWGVAYPHKTDAGPFVPVPLLESIWCLAWVVLCLTGLQPIRELPAGLVFIVAYASGRFFFEFLRHKSDRLFWLGLSEAQWTSLLLITAIVAGYGN